MHGHTNIKWCIIDLQTQLGILWVWTRAFGIRHRLVTTWATAQPDFGFDWIILGRFLKEYVKRVCAVSVWLRMESEYKWQSAAMKFRSELQAGNTWVA